jgi:hypothetical protein
VPSHIVTINNRSVARKDLGDFLMASVQYEVAVHCCKTCAKINCVFIKFFASSDGETYIVKKMVHTVVLQV